MVIYPLSKNYWRERLSDVSKGLFQYPTAPDSPSPLLLAMLTLFALIAVCVLAMKRGERAALSLLLLWLIVPVALPLLLSQILNLPYVVRYLTPALPALYLLVAVGMQRAGSAALRTSSILTPVTLAGLTVTAVLLPVMGALYLSTLHDYFTRVTKEQWRDVASYIKTYAEPHDVLVISKQNVTRAYNYYARGNDLPDSVIPLPPEKVNDVEYEIGGANRVWLLLSHLPEEQQEQFKANVQGAGFKVADRKKYNGIDLTLYENE